MQDNKVCKKCHYTFVKDDELICYRCAGDFMVDSESNRKCPVDNSSMQKLHKGSIVIDKCTTCGGVWLDGSEIDQFVAASSKDQQVTALFTRLIQNKKS